MILSNDGLKRALSEGALEISPAPLDTQYTTSAVGLFPGEEFHVWDAEKLKFAGFRPELDLAAQSFAQTAKAFLIPLKKQDDGSVIFPPFREHPWHMLAITRERVHLNRNFKLAARVEGRSSLARIGIIVHLTAPTIHAGFNGKITLEMINFSPFYLRMVPNTTRICQLIVERLEIRADIRDRHGISGADVAVGSEEITTRRSDPDGVSTQRSRLRWNLLLVYESCCVGLQDDKPFNQWLIVPPGRLRKKS